MSAAEFLDHQGHRLDLVLIDDYRVIAEGIEVLIVEGSVRIQVAMTVKSQCTERDLEVVGDAGTGNGEHHIENHFAVSEESLDDGVVRSD